MSKISYILVLAAFSLMLQVVQAQSAHDDLGSQPVNVPFLEHLVKYYVDSVRAVHDCNALVNDSILYTAATHHAHYMLSNKRLTHDELEREATKTPQLRAEHFGAKNYGVGENVLKTDFNTKIKSKSGKVFDTFTYDGLAKSIVDGWVNSPGHFRNIITPNYQITGVSIAVDPENERLYACQKFADVLFVYSFEESKRLFPYSNYTPPPTPTSFESIENKSHDQKHEWDLRHDELDKCYSCLEIVKHPPQFTLRVENDQFILRVENSNYVKELMKNKWDGFAVELVVFDDYMCGNPDYYTKASRRNGQCEINGRMLQPLYRDDLYRGYKKRKVDKDIKFLSYLVKADSVPFNERTYQFKLDRFESEYFEIKLGRVPRDMTGFWAHNLVYIQDRQVCHIDYLTGYCGQVFSDRVKPSRAPLDAKGEYAFTPKTGQYFFELKFEKNKAEFTKEDIAPLLKSLNADDYRIDSIEINASTSIEGHTATNQQLLKKRMNGILQVFQAEQLDSIKLLAEGHAAWDQFYDAIANSPKWKHLKTLEKEKLIERLNRGLADSLEFILAKHRVGNVHLFYTIPITDETLPDYIHEEYEGLSNKLQSSLPGADSNDFYLQKLSQLYSFTHWAVIEGKIDTSVLAGLRPPPFYNELLPFSEELILCSFEYEKSFENADSWLESRPEMISVLMEESESLSFAFIYTLYMEQAIDLSEREEITREEVQAHIDKLETLQRFYVSDSFAQVNIERINFNLNMLLLNSVFLNDPKANEADAYESLNEVYDWYLKNDGLSDSIVFQLAQMAVHYANNQLALSFTKPHRDVDFIDAYALPLEYTHVSTNGSERFYDYLIEVSETMAPNHWCNLFFSDCGIPFQAFDHEELRNTFCEKCLEENAFMKGLLE